MTKEGDTILGESVHYVLQPQASFVLIDQSNGYVKALSGDRGRSRDEAGGPDPGRADGRS